MEEIAPDIEQTATRIASKYLGFEISGQSLFDDIAAALVAERERCAKIADGVVQSSKKPALVAAFIRDEILHHTR